MPKAKKLPSGNWRVQASVTVNGSRIRRSFTAETSKRAEQLALNWQNDNNLQNCSNINLKQAFERYINAKKNVLSPSTIKGYVNFKNNALNDIMHLKINTLTFEQIQRAINIYSADHSPKSVRNCCGLLSAVLKMFRPDFNLRVSLPQKEKKQIYVPTDDDIKKLLTITKNTNYYVPILLAAFGGLRQGEICALTDKDVCDNGVIVTKSMVSDNKGGWLIKTPKTYSSNRKVELPKFVVDEIKSIKGNLSKQNPHTLSKAFHQIIKNNNLNYFRFHDLRHYYVSSLHSIGIPDKYIMAQGGWSTNYTMQTVYNHVLANKQSEFAEKTTEHFKGVFNNKNNINVTQKVTQNQTSRTTKPNLTLIK